MINKSKECILKILAENSSSLSTQEILDNAKNFPELCTGCRSGTNVINAAMKLLKEGKISRKIAKGGFRWSSTI